MAERQQEATDRHGKSKEVHDEFWVQWPCRTVLRARFFAPENNWPRHRPRESESPRPRAGDAGGNPTTDAPRWRPSLNQPTAPQPPLATGARPSGRRSVRHARDVRISGPPLPIHQSACDGRRRSGCLASRCGWTSLRPEGRAPGPDRVRRGPLTTSEATTPPRADLRFRHLGWQMAAVLPHPYPLPLGEGEFSAALGKEEAFG